MTNLEVSGGSESEVSNRAEAIARLNDQARAGKNVRLFVTSGVAALGQEDQIMAQVGAHSDF